MAKDNSGFRINEIADLLPHRYPFLLVDRVTELEPGEYIRGYKNVTMNEPFFQGHFPGEPIMPGVLILESMAQLGILFAKKTAPDELSGKLFVFAGMDGVKFRRPVVPGDRLEMELTLVKRKMTIWKMAGSARIDGQVAVEAVLTAAVQR
ncbi:MAG: 3-hydroxyacyl-[acyl-carrier-protein] dehydratase FabZ [Thermodesulfatator sp.]|nr:MAG: 3-hydroxyacyl-[acyl-carrier-protein] dehydratase FabZ [Thermodesulfatator sp.]